MRGYDFQKPVDPDNPLDPSDPPPTIHAHVDTSDFRKALFGFESTALRQCREWEARELERLNNRGPATN